MGNDSDPKDDQEGIDFCGAAVIDENGQEIEITEEMVRQAIRALDADADPEAVDQGQRSGNEKAQSSQN